MSTENQTTTVPTQETGIIESIQNLASTVVESAKETFSQVTEGLGHIKENVSCYNLVMKI